MQDALPIVIVAVVVLAGVVAVALAFGARGTYDHIGRSDISFDREAVERDIRAADVVIGSPRAERQRHGDRPRENHDGDDHDWKRILHESRLCQSWPEWLFLTLLTDQSIWKLGKEFRWSISR